MANSNWVILSPSDGELIAGLEKIVSSLSIEQASYTISISEGYNQNLNGPVGNLSTDPILQTLRQSSSGLIRSANLSLPRFYNASVGITRPQLGTPTAAGLDTVSANTGEIPPGELVRFYAAAREVFRPFELTPQLDTRLGAELAEFYRRREGTLARLEELNERLTAENIEHRKKLDLIAEEERSQRAAEFEHRRKELEMEYAEKDGELRKREAEVSHQLSVLDDRSNTHARRQLREDIKKELKNRSTKFTLTEETTQKRQPVHYLFMLLIALSATITGFAFRHADIYTDWVSFARFAVGALATIGAVTFYIRWNDAWARRFASEEFKLRRLELDVDRASWIVEMALEWNEEKDQQIPAELVDRLTRNLFREELDGDRVRHPAEDLASALVGASANLRLQTPIGEVSMDRKGVRQFSDSIKPVEREKDT